MGRFRKAFESSMPHGAPRPRYGPPASAEAITKAERALGLPLPAQLRAMYQDFDGLSHLVVGPEISADRPFATDKFDLYEVLPLRLLPAARDCLSAWYGRVLRSRRTGRVTLEEEEKYATFERELCRCVAFGVWENAVSFCFMTDQHAWGVGRGRVGGYDHVGGPNDSNDMLLEWLTVYGIHRWGDLQFER